MRRRYRVVLLALGAAGVLVLAGGTAAGAPPDTTATNATVHVSNAETVDTNGAADATATSDHRRLVQSQRVQLTPDRPGEVTVRLRYDTPTNLVGLRVQLEAESTVVSTSGFTQQDGRLVWDEQTRQPTVTYRLSVNETRQDRGPLAGPGDYVFVDAGPWAVIRTPQVRNVEYSWTGGQSEQPRLVRENTADGDGAVGDRMTYLGPYEEHQRTVNGQRFRLVVPAEANMAESPDAVFGSLGDASERLRVGTRDDTVFMIAAPTNRVSWGVLGLQTGERDMWVRDRERLATPDNVWVHEYVHTRQDFRTTAETRWLTEATASYYAALLTLEQGRIDFEEFESRLHRGVTGTGSDAVLTDPGTWHPITPYWKGALVTGELDRQARLAGSGTFQSVFRDLNAHGEPVTEADYREIVRRTAGDGTLSTSDRYTTTRESPTMWSRDDHDAAFNTPLPRVEYAIPGPTEDGYTVAGPYRTGPVNGDPVRLVPGEELTVDVTVTNDGTAAGDYDARLRVDGRTVDNATGSLEAGEQTTVRLSHRFDTRGESTLAVGNSRRQVRVTDPAAPAVSGLAASRTEVAPGESVTLTASLDNPDAVPAVGEVTLSRNGVAVASENVTLDAGATTEVTFEQTVDDPGTHQFSVGERTATVTVREDRTTASEGPGFGVTVAVVAVALALLARRASAGP